MSLQDGTITQAAAIALDAEPSPLSRAGSALRDVVAMIRRNLLHIAREPEQPRGQRSRGYREKGADHLHSIAAASLAGAGPIW